MRFSSKSGKKVLFKVQQPRKLKMSRLPVRTTLHALAVVDYHRSSLGGGKMFDQLRLLPSNFEIEFQLKKHTH